MTHELPKEYVAALLDHSGSFVIGIQKRKHKTGNITEGYPIRLTVSGLTDVVARSLVKQYGGSVLRYLGSQTKSENSYHVRFASRDDLENIIQDCLPFMLPRRKQAGLFLSILQFDELWPGHGHPYTDDARDMWREAVEEIFRLNENLPGALRGRKQKGARS